MAQRDQPVAPAQSEQHFSQTADAETGSFPRTHLRDEAGSQTTNQSAQPSFQESKRRIPQSTTASTSFLSSLLPKMHFRTFFERLGHKLNPTQRSKDLDDNEPMKEVCSNSRSSVLWHFILFHLPAVLVTTTLLVLYAMNIRWNPSHPTIDELAALQFAAKAQESLILISLADILLHRIHYGLLGKNGVPLGFLSSPFYLGFSLRYLISREFWSAMLKPTANRHFHGATAAVVFIFALLGLASGPSSAIAMIPRFDWWQVSDSASNYLSGNVGGDPEYEFIRGSPYTMKFESQDIRKLETCSYADEIKNLSCVNQNLSPIMQTLTGHMSSMSSSLQNITVPSLPLDWLVRPISFGFDKFSLFEDQQAPGGLPPIPGDRSGQLAYAVTPIDVVAQSLVYYSQRFKDQVLSRSEASTVSGKEKWKQPLVAVHCAPFYWLRELNPTSATFAFGDRLYDNFTVSLDFNSTLRPLKNMPEDYMVTSILMDIQHLLSVPITASILFASSYMADREMMQSVPPDPQVEVFPWMDIELCLVQARWVETEVWLYPKESLEIQSHLGFPTSDIMQYIRQKSDPESIIRMTVEWLRDIGVPPNSTSTSKENPAYQQGMDLCADGFFTGESCLPSFLAVYLTEALSQSTALTVDYQESRSRPSPRPNSTLIFNTYFEHVYAYGFRESITITVAFTTLLLQVFIALIHLVLTVFARQPWHCSAWGDFGQLLTLALRSDASDELRNVGAGVRGSRTWKLMTVVREVGDERQLKMVVGAPALVSRQDQTNTDVEERGATEMRIPQVGTKYG